MIIPPKEFQPYIHVVPDEWFAIDDSAPEEVKKAFAIWIECIKEFLADWDF